jgi:hypothetical protein
MGCYRCRVGRRAAASSQATSEQKAGSSQNEIAKAGADEAESAAVKDTSAAADNPDHPTAKSPKPYTEKKRADSPKHASPKNATAKADNGSQSDGANQE